MPYPWIKFVEGKKIMIADGIAMSCRNTGIIQPSLEYFYQGILDIEKYSFGVENREYLLNPDLNYLCAQGIMMLNTALTTELNKPNAHSQLKIDGKQIRLWEPFMKYFLEEVLASMSGIILVFCGAESQYYQKYVMPLQHYCIEVEHPAGASHRGRPWIHQDIFLKINKILKENNNLEVEWLDYDLPF